MAQSPASRCPCCGYRTGCTTCPVCYWTDDGHAIDGFNGDLTLAEAQLNFSIYGASAPRYQDLVRSARPDELP